jgi:signal transduction histidine kinase
MSKLWLTTQDLFFSGQETYLAKGIYKQSSQLTQTIIDIKLKTKGNSDKNLAQALLTALKNNDKILKSFQLFSTLDINLWQKTVAESDIATSNYVSDLEKLSKSINNNNSMLSKKYVLAHAHFIKLAFIIVMLYLLFTLLIVSWFSKYIVKPIENITMLAQQPLISDNLIEFRQIHAPVEVIALSDAIHKFSNRITIEKKKAEEEHHKAVRANDKANVIMNTMPCSVLLINEKGTIIECNHETEKLFESKKSDVINNSITHFIPALFPEKGNFDSDYILQNMHECLLPPEIINPYIEFSGRKIEINDTIHYLMTISDIHKRKHDQRALTALSEQLVNAEKLASIGQLSAGIAHEINNPVGFIRSNIDVLTDYFKPIVSYINLLHDHDCNSETQSLYEEEDLAFVLSDIEPLLSSTLEGTTRISGIIKDLGNYAHVDNKSAEPILIDELIEQSLNLVNNELKYKVEIVKNLNSQAQVLGFPQKLLQVFINILVNASHAIENRGLISITSSISEAEVIVIFEDNGSGISQDNLKSIFDPFFTTKPVGKGTGLGLHIVRAIIENHQGRINVSSILGTGSKFEIYLPMVSNKLMATA